jgi:Putative Actinobacterial Holin-X, holin superfamily III
MSHPVDQTQQTAGLPERNSPRRSALEAEDGRSIGDLLSDVSSNISTLLQQEIALAKAEARQTGTRAGKGVGMFAGAAVGGLLFLAFLSVSAWWGLGQFIGWEWSGLVVALVWAIVAGVLAMMGKKEFERIRGLEKTTETLTKIPNAVRGHEEENR